MKKSEFKDLLNYMRIQKEAREKWLSEIPRDIVDVFFDNYYVTNLTKELDYFAELYLGKELFQEAQWFLWDRPHDARVVFCGEERVINNVDEFVDFLKDLNMLGDS